MLDANTYSLSNYSEFDRVLEQWSQLRWQAEKINQSLPANYQDAFFQLVLHPVQAFENLHQLYYAVSKNRLYASQKNALANEWADKAKAYYEKDSLLSVRYNKETANGKWNHMMDQTHIGYTSWQEPRRNSLPLLTYISPDSAQAIKASEKTMEDGWKKNNRQAVRASRFIEKDGYVSIDATHYTKAVHITSLRWKIIPGIGRDGDGITTFPVTVSSRLSTSGPHLEYEIYTTSKDSLKLLTCFSPTLNYHNAPTGLQFAVSIDNEKPQIIGLNKEDNTGVWNGWVANNIITKTTRHMIASPGKHVIKYWAIDPGIVLQKLVINFGGVKPAYLTPPETIKEIENNR